MRFKSIIKRHKKRTILAVSILGVSALTIGGVIAYSQSRDVLEGKFKLFGYKTLFTETFDAPSNWMTCDTVDKTITVTNKYDEPVSVRLKLEEQWLASDGTTELPLVSANSGLTMAQINFTQNSGWTKRGRYYYYDTDLAKDATTTSPISGVTLNCDANLDTLDPTADGVYSDATYHLKITAQTIVAEGKDTWDTSIYNMIAKQANDPTAYTIDFTKKAIVSDDIATANGNGVNKYTENGQDIYYFRGQVNNNNVIWANKCWKIIRTTYTGGTKIIYNGTPSDVVVDGETVKQCLATGMDSQITVNVGGTTYRNTFMFNSGYESPADVGYMYGARPTSWGLSVGSKSFTFSNNVSRSGNTYILDTGTGQSITGTWADERTNAAVKYHYFCTDGATSCHSSDIGYILYFGDSRIFYLRIGGYDDIEAAKTAMFTNTTDSKAKATVETWFEQQNLDGHIADTRNYEDDLEDAIFCNDRTYYSGSLKGKDSDATPSGNTAGNFHGAYGRNVVKNSSNNLDPSLDCANQNDAFTKSDSTNGNAKLKHKIGLATADELTLAGTGVYGYDTTAYLYTGQDTWLASPRIFDANLAREFAWGSSLNGYGVSNERGLRPLVSLKSGTEFASGSGLNTDPYIVE